MRPDHRNTTRRSARCLFALVACLLVAGGALAAAPPDFKLKDLSGGSFRLSDHLGKEVVYISFWATWCVPCRRELPELQKMYDELASKGFLVVAVNTDPPANESQVKPWVRQHKFTFPFVLDPDNNTLDKYNPSRALPYGVLVDRQGNIHTTYPGYKTGGEALLRQEVEKLLAQGAAAPSSPEGTAPATGAK
jgi:peroxiredoxin